MSCSLPQHHNGSPLSLSYVAACYPACSKCCYTANITCMEHSTMVTDTIASCRVTSERNISLAWAARINHFLISHSILVTAVSISYASAVSSCQYVMVLHMASLETSFSDSKQYLVFSVQSCSKMLMRMTLCKKMCTSSHLNTWNVRAWELDEVLVQSSHF